MRDDIESFINWAFDEKNKRFVKSASPRKIAEEYNKDTNNNITHIYVINNRFRWIKIDGSLYDVSKLPPFILYAESFKKYAKDNNMTIETLDWSIKPDDKSSENHNDPIVEEASSTIEDPIVEDEK